MKQEVHKCFLMFYVEEIKEWDDNVEKELPKSLVKNDKFGVPYSI
jgi:hypothetical protein